MLLYSPFRSCEAGMTQNQQHTRLDTKCPVNSVINICSLSQDPYHNYVTVTK